MAALKSMAESAAQYPSQGAATVFETLNMHTQPNRFSPSLWQIPDNGKVDVIGHKLASRSPLAAAPAPAPPPMTAPTRRKSTDRQIAAKIPPPPPPPAPRPPRDWLALSVPKLQAGEPDKQDSPKANPKPVAPVPMDDWSLVRTAEGKAGWVLTSKLSMAIPDEVAQYAEGHRITSYFPVGEIKEGDTIKTNWLWTTITKGLQPYEFDSFRVFVWSHKHHRYETAYIERNVTGHFPVAVNKSGAAASFSLILEGSDGRLTRKTYSFEGFRIRMVHKEPYEMGAQIEPPKPAARVPAQQTQPGRSLVARLKDRLRRLFR
jgi:hypothetical protein